MNIGDILSIVGLSWFHTCSQCRTWQNSSSSGREVSLFDYNLNCAAEHIPFLLYIHNALPLVSGEFGLFCSVGLRRVSS